MVKAHVLLCLVVPCQGCYLFPERLDSESSCIVVTLVQSIESLCMQCCSTALVLGAWATVEMSQLLWASSCVHHQMYCSTLETANVNGMVCYMACFITVLIYTQVRCQCRFSRQVLGYRTFLFCERSCCTCMSAPDGTLPASSLS